MQRNDEKSWIVEEGHTSFVFLPADDGDVEMNPGNVEVTTPSISFPMPTASRGGTTSWAAWPAAPAVCSSAINLTAPSSPLGPELGWTRTTSHSSLSYAAASSLPSASSPTSLFASSSTFSMPSATAVPAQLPNVAVSSEPVPFNGHATSTPQPSPAWSSNVAGSFEPQFGSGWLSNVAATFAPAPSTGRAVATLPPPPPAQEALPYLTPADLAGYKKRVMEIYDSFATSPKENIGTLETNLMVLVDLINVRADPMASNWAGKLDFFVLKQNAFAASYAQANTHSSVIEEHVATIQEQDNLKQTDTLFSLLLNDPYTYGQVKARLRTNSNMASAYPSSRGPSSGQNFTGMQGLSDTYRWSVATAGYPPQQPSSSSSSTPSRLGGAGSRLSPNAHTRSPTTTASSCSTYGISWATSSSSGSLFAAPALSLLSGRGPYQTTSTGSSASASSTANSPSPSRY